jgi:hypothetical protein
MRAKRQPAKTITQSVARGRGLGGSETNRDPDTLYACPLARSRFGRVTRRNAASCRAASGAPAQAAPPAASAAPGQSGARPRSAGAPAATACASLRDQHAHSRTVAAPWGRTLGDIHLNSIDIGPLLDDLDHLEGQCAVVWRSKQASIDGDCQSAGRLIKILGPKASTTVPCSSVSLRETRWPLWRVRLGSCLSLSMIRLVRLNLLLLLCHWLGAHLSFVQHT